MNFKENDKVLLDNKVPGKVDGFYQNYVVFKPEYHMGRTCYGKMPYKAYDLDDAGNQELKLVSYSLMLVHPSNLTPDEPA